MLARLRFKKVLELRPLFNRILELSYKYKLAHVGSCITAAEIMDEIYKNKKKEDIFVLSAGHSGVAYYAILEKYEGRNAEKLLNKHGVHPNRDIENGIPVSSGSLGLGLSIAVGMALADKNRIVYCLISDGECAEGIVWESLRLIKEKKIKNIKVYVNANGFSAYEKIDLKYLSKRLKSFLPDIQIRKTYFRHPFLNGLDAHYHILTKEDLNV